MADAPEIALDLPRQHHITPEDEQKAAALVRSRARDEHDARQLLEVLGLIEPHHTLQGGPVSTPDLEIIVRHRPAPQGSKRHIGGGRLIEESKRVAPWRRAVAAAACAVLTGDDGEPRAPLDGPLSAEVVFTVRKPQSHKRVSWPTTRDSGDIDKLLRSTFDALASAGAIVDDARVVEVTARKVHPGEGLDALDEPGAVIRVWRLPTEVTG